MVISGHQEHLHAATGHQFFVGDILRFPLGTASRYPKPPDKTGYRLRQSAEYSERPKTGLAGSKGNPTTGKITFPWASCLGFFICPPKISKLVMPTVVKESFFIAFPWTKGSSAPLRMTSGANPHLLQNSPIFLSHKLFSPFFFLLNTLQFSGWQKPAPRFYSVASRKEPLSCLAPGRLPAPQS